MFGIAPWVFIDKTTSDVHKHPTGNKLAFAYLGDVEFELLHPVVLPAGKKHPTMWREFLDVHGEGLHHIAFGVDDVKAETAKLVAQGAKVRIAGNIWAYLDVADAGIGFIELLEIHEPHPGQKA
jgi:catechol 2,3-dioxygenase-like lactoylglutathione lyase family enzyme